MSDLNAALERWLLARTFSFMCQSSWLEMDLLTCKCMLYNCLRYTTPDIRCRQLRQECDGGINIIRRGFMLQQQTRIRTA